jgi:ATP-dependent Clp protease adaptor protein ClpS
MENELEKTEQIPEIDVITEEDSDIGLASKVILYNDDWHSFDEVILQLIKAINCTFEQARAFAFEVHVKGKSIVFHGQLNQCLKVSSILEEIALNTQVIT